MDSHIWEAGLQRLPTRLCTKYWSHFSALTQSVFASQWDLQTACCVSTEAIGTWDASWVARAHDMLGLAPLFNLPIGFWDV